MSAPHRPRPWSFLLLAYGISWCIAGIGIANGVTSKTKIGFLVTASTFMLGPAIAALIQQFKLDRAPWQGLGLRLPDMRWRVLIYTVLVGVVFIPGCLFLTYVLGDVLHISSFGHVSMSHDHVMQVVRDQLSEAGVSASSLDKLLSKVQLSGWSLLSILMVLVVLLAFTFNLPAMMGEELGWRGYLFQALAHWSGAKRVLFTGVVWGLWHAPLIAIGHNYPGHPVLGIGLMVVFTVLLAVLFDWSRMRSRTVWAPCVLHGIINGSAGAYLLFAWDGDPLIASPTATAGFLTIALIASAVLILDRSYRAHFFQGGPIGGYQR